MKAVKALVALTIGIFVSLFAAEWVVAHFGAVDTPPGLFMRSATRPFVHKPLFKGRDRFRNPILINSQGLRDREYSLEKPVGTFRIFVLGDSVAFADGLKAEDGFAKQMEALWVAEGRKVEVINGGVRGYNTASEYLMLKEVGAKYSPDLVLIAYVLNDAEPTSKQGGLIDRKNSWLVAIKDYVKDHFYLYSFFRRCIEIFRHQAAAKGVVETYEDQFRADHPGWQENYAALQNIKKFTLGHNEKLLLAIFPRLEGLKEGEIYPANALHAQVMRSAQENSIDAIDLLPVLQGQDEERIKIEPRDTFHPNAAGHRLIAQALKRVIDAKYRSAV